MTFLIIGNGRTARHIEHYLKLTGASIVCWHYRKQSPEYLKELAQNADRVLLLIKDSAINGFLDEHSFLKKKTTIHFSGALQVDSISNVHPLVSFGIDLFEPDFYQSIPFAYFGTEDESFNHLFPNLHNPSFYVPKIQKALYHGLCVASGNLTVLLWHSVAKEMQRSFGIQQDTLIPYLNSVANNLTHHWSEALTGPIARKDKQTLLKNYQSLGRTPLKPILEAHIALAWPEFAEEFFLNK